VFVSKVGASVANSRTAEMGVRTIVGVRDGLPDEGTPCACMMDSVTGVAFGPVFGSYEECEAFQKWWGATQATHLRAYNAHAPEWAEQRDVWVVEGRPFYDAENDEAKGER
jgi:hypothetical protein